MGPVAAPHQSLWRRLDERLRNPGGFRIVGWPDLAVGIGAGQLDPGATPVEKAAQDRMGRVVRSSRKWRMAQMIEHRLRRQTPQKVRVGDDIVAVDIELHMPAEFVDALRQRLDHVPSDHGVRTAEGKTDAADAGIVEAFQFRISDGRMHYRHTSRTRAQLLQCIDGDAVVGGIVAWLYNDNTRGAGALLQKPVVRHG